MGPSTQALRKKVSGPCSVCENIQRQGMYTMVNGVSTPKMGGGYFKTKRQVINMRDLGNKTNEMVSADSKL